MLPLAATLAALGIVTLNAGSTSQLRVHELTSQLNHKDQKEQEARVGVQSLQLRVQELTSQLNHKRQCDIPQLDSSSPTAWATEKTAMEAKLKAAIEARERLRKALAASQSREGRLAGALRHAEESLVDAYRAQAQRCPH